MAEPLTIAAFGLPEVPGPELDPYLDAATRCFARHGLRRTKVLDIADEARVSRVTVYRQLGNVEHAARLLLAREIDRLLSGVVPRLATAEDPEAVITVIVDVVRFAVDHPVLTKVLRDEPDLVGEFLVTELDGLLDRLRRLAEPVLDRLAALGVAPPIDPASLVDWVTRVLVTLVLAPPPGDLDAHLRAVLGPLLATAPAHAGRRGRRALRPSPS